VRLRTLSYSTRFCAAAPRSRDRRRWHLAFTFTERAADQLRHRVREELTRLAAEAEGERLEALIEARAATDRAWNLDHPRLLPAVALDPPRSGRDRSALPRPRRARADRLAGRAFDDALETLIEAGGAEGLELAAANRRRTCSR